MHSRGIHRAVRSLSRVVDELVREKFVASYCSDVVVVLELRIALVGDAVRMEECVHPQTAAAFLPKTAGFTFWQIYHDTARHGQTYPSFGQSGAPYHGFVLSGRGRNECNVRLAELASALPMFAHRAGESLALIALGLSSYCLQLPPYIGLGSWRMDEKGWRLPCKELSTLNLTRVFGGHTDAALFWAVFIQQWRVRRPFGSQLRHLHAFFHDYINASDVQLSPADVGLGWLNFPFPQPPCPPSLHTDAHTHPCVLFFRFFAGDCVCFVLAARFHKK